MTRSLLLALSSCLISTAAFAQSKVLEDKKAPTYNEIERGVFFGVNGGFEAFLVSPGSGVRPVSPGQAVQVEFGYDIGERISPSLFLIATSNRAGADYTGYSNHASGDFSSLTPGVGVKIRLVGFADDQELQRTWIYVRAQAGFTVYQPASLIDRPDLLISAGPGIEYFTRLRHFSIGVEATFNFMALTQSIGFSVLPSVRYAF